MKPVRCLKAVAKIQVEFSTLSPFRYPGGKSWLRAKILAWIRSLAVKPRLFLEAFAGGASASLAIAEVGIVDRVLMIERDPQVAAVWKVIFGDDYRKLIRLIQSFKMSRDAVLEVFSSHPRDTLETAFCCLLQNRVSRGGIIAEGAGILRNGENGRGLASRWYPETLVDRIERIHALSDRIRIRQGDGLTDIHRLREDDRVAVFADPPYTTPSKAPGRRLYRFGSIDHRLLFRELKRSAGSFLLTYHSCSEIRVLAHEHTFTMKRVAMRTTHHRRRFELLITR